MSGDEEPPMYRLEHSVSDKAGCQQKSCKASKVKIAKGELRLGVYTWFEPSQQFITSWKHWRCVLPGQLKNIIELADDDPESLPGFPDISAESQKQVKRAFKDSAVDELWSNIRTDLIKIKKGELRLGIATLYDGHVSWVYKHWRCMTAYDLRSAKEKMIETNFGGLDQLPEELQRTVLRSFKYGKAFEPPVLETVKETKPKKPRAKKEESDDVDAAAEPTTAGVKRPADEDEGVGEDALPKKKKKKKKKRGRAVKKAVSLPCEQQDPVEQQMKAISEPASFEQFFSEVKRDEQIDPAVAKTQAMADAMRAEAD
ncbi:zf-PARP-domain-containing protein [Lophiostoma macrostomum CBS 122681]|uniref:Zf-PARP-domain-containing protein n=1 Tax=Lophiostoma macrostomum CBS 122681 TaxID=1314788 RepID=A0A6A6T528_9PLEO|nr:zf-PARP-domain-containing protein [Lophiostoma macrostomum CBS 122681]